jgi:uroporphyrin-III C-methyltransferase
MKHYKAPKLTLAGAGPGDPDLISIKALRAIAQADVVLYDALVNPALLQHAHPEATVVYVGKRKGEVAYTQEQINNLIVDYAHSHGHVVRLKGGDPFVFGRGMEEVIYAGKFNITTDVIPGISSSIAVPALAGIPVSHRGMAQSFWVLTATLSDGSLNPDLRRAAQSNATVVVLMGLSKLADIAALYAEAGREGEAVAVISNGSLPVQRTVTGTLARIAAQVQEARLPAPAVIVIGKVVRLATESREPLREAEAQAMLQRIQNQLGLPNENANTHDD